MKTSGCGMPTFAAWPLTSSGVNDSSPLEDDRRTIRVRIARHAMAGEMPAVVDAGRERVLDLGELRIDRRHGATVPGQRQDEVAFLGRERQPGIGRDDEGQVGEPEGPLEPRHRAASG